MYDATDSTLTADQIVAAVHSMRDQRDELLNRLDDAEHALRLMQQERDELRRELVKMRSDSPRIFSMDVPGGRSWAFHEDIGVLALSPELDRTTRERLIAQTMPPKLTACATCGAPVYAGQTCGIHQ